MPDIVVTITDTEVKVLESFYETAMDGVRQAVLRRAKTLAGAVVEESDSRYDPRKLSTAALRAEIDVLDAAGKIPTYAERYPTEPVE